MLPDQSAEWEVERAVLGSVLSDPRLMAQARAHLQPSAFSTPKHRELYRLMQTLDTESAGSCDAVSVAHRIESGELHESCGNREFLRDLMASVPSVAFLQNHVETLRVAARKRGADSQLASIFERFRRGDITSEDALASCSEAHFESVRQYSTAMPKRLSEVDAELRKEVRSRRELTSIPGLVPTPFSGLNAYLKGGGLGPGQLVVVAARTGVGKTVFALDLAEYAAQEGPVLFASLEMTGSELLQRLYLRRSGSDGANIGRAFGATVDPVLAATEEASLQMRSLRLHILDSTSLTMSEIRGHAYALRAQESGLRMVVIDYLQLVTAARASSNQTRAELVAQITREAKVMAKELRCPVVVVAQLNRASENRPDHRPVLSDLRESGAIEQDADVVFMLSRFPEESRTEADFDFLYIRKNRHGETGDIPMRFNAMRQTWQIDCASKDNCLLLRQAGKLAGNKVAPL